MPYMSWTGAGSPVVEDDELGGLAASLGDAQEGAHAHLLGLLLLQHLALQPQLSRHAVGLLGVTDFLKRRVALPFRGNFAEFRHTLRHEMVHVFQISLLVDR